MEWAAMASLKARSKNKLYLSCLESFVRITFSSTFVCLFWFGVGLFLPFFHVSATYHKVGGKCTTEVAVGITADKIVLRTAKTFSVNFFE